MRKLCIGGLVLLATLGTQALGACQEETVVYPAIVVQRFEGRFIGNVVEELMLSADFTVREENTEDPDSVIQVLVAADGSFELALPEGTYQYSIRFEGFFITLEGQVEVSDDARPEEEILLDPPTC